MIIYENNLQTIKLMNSKIARIDTKLKHVDIAQCWLRKMIQNDHIRVDYLLTDQMIANDLTKLLSSQKHREFVTHVDFVDVRKLVIENES